MGWISIESVDLNRLPGALAKDLVEVQCDRLLLDEALHFSLHGGGEDPHQSLGSKPAILEIEFR